MSASSPTGAEAAAAGLRACLRCKPDDVSRDSAAVEAALKLIETAEEPPSLEQLAARAGYSPFHFHRLFKRATGVTPAAYARGKRARTMTETLAADGRVTDAIYDSGYSGPGRFYADAKDRLGMTPTRWRDGGRGETISWATARDVARHDAGRGDRARHLPALLRRGRGGAEAALPQRGDRAGRRGDGRAGRAHRRRGRGAGAAARPSARRPRHRLPGSGVARARPDPARARACPTRRWRRGRAGRRRCGRRERPAARTRSRSSSPATAPAAATARPAAMPTGSSARPACSSARAGAARKASSRIPWWRRPRPRAPPWRRPSRAWR